MRSTGSSEGSGLTAEHPEGWEQRALYDLATYTNGRATKPAEGVDDGVPLIKIAELNRGIGSTTVRLDPAAIQDKHWVVDGDLLFAWSGSVGIYIYRGSDAALNQHIFKVEARGGVDQAFLRYCLDAQMGTFQQYVEAKRTTMGHVTVADLRTTEILLPPIDEQRRIAEVLAPLDAKIDTNQQLALAVQRLSATLYRSWFSDFDAVKAKMAGEAVVGMPAGAESLLPDTLQRDAELGDFPSGWEIRTLGDISQLVKSPIQPSKHPEENFAHFSIPAYDESHAPSLDDGRDILSGKVLLDQPTILVSKLNPHRWWRVWCVQPADHLRAVCSTEFVPLTPTGVPFSFLGTALAFDSRVRGQVLSLTSGTTSSRQRFRPGDLLKVRLVVPPPVVLAPLADALAPLIVMSGELARENAALVQLRRTLVPRLLSGDLRVPELPEVRP